MLNPPDEGKLGITLIYEDNLPVEKESKVKEKIIKKLNSFFRLSELELSTTLIEQPLKIHIENMCIFTLNNILVLKLKVDTL